MTDRRPHVSLKTKLASALLTMLRPDENGKLVPVIPFDQAKRMTADQILSLFQFDHAVLHAWDGPAEPWNLTPRFIMEHREKTKRDVKAHAKVRRSVQKAVAEIAPAKAKRKSRPIPGSKASGWKKTFSNGWMRRDEE